MATLIVTKDKGGAGRSADMTVVLPSQEVPIEALRSIGNQAGLDGVALADTVSAMAMHCRAAARFALAAAQQAVFPERRKIHEALADTYTSRVDAFESLLSRLKLPRLYASPASRMQGFLVESLTQAPLLAGSPDAETLEFTLLDVALTLAETALADNTALAAIVSAAQPSNTTTALQKALNALNAASPTLEKLRAVRQTGLVAMVKSKHP